MTASRPHLLITRPGTSTHLASECRNAGMKVQHLDHDHVVVEGDMPVTAFVLERQRLPSACLIPTNQLKPFDESTCASIWQELMPELSPWALHFFAAEESELQLDKRIPALERFLRKAGRQQHSALAKFERKPEKLFRQNKGLVLQAFLSEQGLWLSTSAPHALTASRPGGRYRMKMDPDAPSRSYLKIEEALARMDSEPQEGAAAIDLGAAPGGWTWAFVKRGCHVTAVDNGPMKLPAHAAAQVTHLQADGMRFRLPPEESQVEWMVGDMLIPPGKAFSLLRYWVGEKRTRNLVMNIKLPQEEPVPALQPIQDWLNAQTAWDLQIRQLYHDRREVTVFGRINE